LGPVGRQKGPKPEAAHATDAATEENKEIVLHFDQVIGTKEKVKNIKSNQT
jgi:hypothetical protein